MLILAMALSMLGGAQAVAIPIPSMPPRVQPVPRPTVTMPVDEAVRVDLRVERKPDLLVKEIRMKDYKTVQVLIANKGDVAVKFFDMSVVAYSGSKELGGNMTSSLDSLSKGETRWFTINKFVPYVKPHTSDAPPVFKISEMTGISVWVDPEGYRMSSAGERYCSTNAGCIDELNEDNNRRYWDRTGWK
jgi:hypothetical protein